MVCLYVCVCMCAEKYMSCLLTLGENLFIIVVINHSAPPAFFFFVFLSTFGFTDHGQQVFTQVWRNLTDPGSMPKKGCSHPK